MCTQRFVSTPTIDHNGCSASDLGRFARQNVDHNLKGSRVTDLEKLRTRAHDAFAFAKHLENATGNGGANFELILLLFRALSKTP